MAGQNPGAPRISAAALTRFIAAAYRAVGIPAAAAEKAAQLMAASDISGADGHGGVPAAAIYPPHQGGRAQHRA